MSVWVWRDALSAEKEERIEALGFLPLPIPHGAPDLSRCDHADSVRRAIAPLYPDMAPETVAQLADRWFALLQIDKDDVIAVVLSRPQEVSLALASDRPCYVDGRHCLPVTWNGVRVPRARFGANYAELFERNQSLYEITNPEDRNVIRSWLPNRYNRFARWKWVLAALLILEAIMFATQRP